MHLQKYPTIENRLLYLRFTAVLLRLTPAPIRARSPLFRRENLWSSVVRQSFSDSRVFFRCLQNYKIFIVKFIILRKPRESFWNNIDRNDWQAEAKYKYTYCTASEDFVYANRCINKNRHSAKTKCLLI